MTAPPPPPMLSGLPLLGNALEFRNDPLGLFRRGYAQHGPVFGIKLAMQKAAVVVGAERIRFFFEQTDDELSMNEVYQFLVPIVGGKVLFTASPEEYAEQKRIMLPAFQGRKLGSYVRAMAAEVNAWMATLGNQGEFELIATADRLTMAMVTHAVFGAKFREKVGDEFPQLFSDLSGGLEFVLPTNLPLPRFRRRDRALRRLQAVLTEVIRERRERPEDFDDFLQVLLGASYMEAEKIPDEKLVMILVGLMFGGRENTAGHLEWCVVQLLRHRPWLEQVTSEVHAALKGGEPTMENLRGMQVLGACLKETDRLRPMTVTLVRLNHRDYVMDGYTIPKGWITVAGIALTQRLPEIFTDPETWDPGRFLGGRNEEVPYAITNFGGGHHKCWAQAFVTLEMKTVIALLLRDFELELVNPDPPSETNHIGVTRPKSPCLIRYRRRS